MTDHIDHLVDYSLNHGHTGGDDTGQDYCPHCRWEWHGLEGDGYHGDVYCPGAYATPDQAADYLALREQMEAQRWAEYEENSR